MLPCAQILKENKFLDFPLFLQTKLNAYWHGLLRQIHPYKFIYLIVIVIAKLLVAISLY